MLSDLDLWAENIARRVTTEVDDVARATRLVKRFELGLRMPDALILAIAQRLSMAIATQDRRQAAAAEALGLRLIQPQLS